MCERTRCSSESHKSMHFLGKKRFAFAMLVWKIFNQESSLNLHKMWVPQQVQHRVHHAKTETNSMIPSGRDSSSKVPIFVVEMIVHIEHFFHSFANPNVCAFVHHRAIVFLLSDTLPSHSATGMASVKHEANAAANNCNPTTRLRNLAMCLWKKVPPLPNRNQQEWPNHSLS